MAEFSGQTFDRYTILERQGEGGMAVVYRALDTRLDREVAIKVIRRELFARGQETQVLARFQREARALARLTHPNIIPIYDYGEHEGSPYLVMPFIAGGTLKHQLGSPMNYVEAARLLAPVARALEFAHQRGILHRDVKPSNLLLADSGQLLLGDFGIAKLVEERMGETLTGTGAGLGTPEYMAPEAWVGKAEAASDQYSLGIVFYEMVTGRRPFTADTPAAVLIQHVNDPLPSPRKLAPGLSADVEKLLYKALAKKPGERFGSMGELCAALEKLAAQAPVPRRGENLVTQVDQRAMPSAPPRPPLVETVVDPPRGSPPNERTRLNPASKWRKWVIAAGLFALAAIVLGFALSRPAAAPVPTSTPTRLPATLASTAIPSATPLPPTATLTATTAPSQTPTMTVTPTASPTPSPTVYSGTRTPFIPTDIYQKFTSQVTPSPNAVFGMPLFGKSINSSNLMPINPSYFFYNPVGRLYASFAFDKTYTNTQWTALWVRLADQTIVCYETKTWDGGPSGFGFTSCINDTTNWQPGEYVVELYWGVALKSANKFTVADAQSSGNTQPQSGPTATPQNCMVQVNIYTSLTNNQPIPGVDVRISGPGGNFYQTTTSEGYAQFMNLAVGDYRVVSVSHTSYKLWSGDTFVVHTDCTGNRFFSAKYFMTTK